MCLRINCVVLCPFGAKLGALGPVSGKDGFRDAIGSLRSIVFFRFRSGPSAYAFKECGL